MNDSKNTAAPAGQSERRAAKQTTFVLLQDINRPFRHLGSHWPTGTQHKPGISSPSHRNRGITLLLTGLLSCKCFSAITREAPRPARVERGRGRKRQKAEFARVESPLLPSALAAPGPTPSPGGSSSPTTHLCLWSFWIAFHPLQFYTNKAILWSQHSYESLHTFLGWNTNCLTSQSKLHNCSQDGIKEAVSN